MRRPRCGLAVAGPGRGWDTRIYRRASARRRARSPTRCCTPAPGRCPPSAATSAAASSSCSAPRTCSSRWSSSAPRWPTRACSRSRACRGSRPRSSGPTGCQRVVPGRSAAQHFFSEGGRAFCLFTVLGSHARRMALVPRAAQLVGALRRHRPGHAARREDRCRERARRPHRRDAGPSARLVERARPAAAAAQPARLPRRTRRRRVGAGHRPQGLRADAAARRTPRSAARPTPPPAAGRVFCCTVNKGVNACPPGSFTAGWWKAADSSWCGGGYRYIVDCNARCVECSTGCAGDHICDRKCWNCSCGSGSTATCDQRRHCCNAFRYGQCNTQVKCSGGVHCRVVSCVAAVPVGQLHDHRRWSTTATAEHSAPCLQGWGAILQPVRRPGRQRARPSAPRSAPSGRSATGAAGYVDYRGGSIYWTSRTGARAISRRGPLRLAPVRRPARAPGLPDRRARGLGRPDSAWSQGFQRGVVCDSPGDHHQRRVRRDLGKWVALGRERGRLGLPRARRPAGPGPPRPGAGVRRRPAVGPVGQAGPRGDRPGPAAVAATTARRPAGGGTRPGT